ncbi:hypothetical protein [Arthrobacter caoxuetaonis]|uniref:Uncharacterized protein n=1 Tax=Arthrobacter caoxuetaonis TaxID=2886935 RepID=A0A9X1SEB9_9MICC|nr:hypothetical protein [Arthrobacter caoxuetaonis]MCC3299697.1 hypothetical protein [Arthrobacter caoxuetaonis]USQ58962.1 hypothetical protein NF551_17805 [Arthrobacter caoxuetaonis]
MQSREKYAGEGSHPDFSSGVVRFPYRREPYARVQLKLEGGGEIVRDVRVQARTGDSTHLLIFFDDEGDVHSFWIPARSAKRISRAESSWIDPYDEGQPED